MIGNDSTPIFGWKLMTHNKKQTKKGTCIYKCCLGVFVCSKCSFVRPPCQPKSKSKGSSPPLPKDKCMIHPELDLIHHTCSCTLNIVNAGKSWIVTHSGNHNHPRPPWSGKLDTKSLYELEAVIQNNAKATPSQLKLGNATRKPVIEIHPSLCNLDKLKHERKKILGSLERKSTLANFSNLGKDLPQGSIREHDLLSKFPYIIYQDNDMLKMLSEAETCLESDSVEGFILEKDIEKQINITFTSAYDSLLDRWVPLCISFLFGKSVEDYKNHWKYVFSCFQAKSWDDFKEKFPGNVCDMSDAFKEAFFCFEGHGLGSME